MVKNTKALVIANLVLFVLCALLIAYILINPSAEIEHSHEGAVTQSDVELIEKLASLEAELDVVKDQLLSVLSPGVVGENTPVFLPVDGQEVSEADLLLEGGVAAGLQIDAETTAQYQLEAERYRAMMAKGKISLPADSIRPSKLDDVPKLDTSSGAPNE